MSVPVDILDFLTTKVLKGILLIRASVMFLDFRNTKLAMKDDFTGKFVQQQKSPNRYCLMFLNYRNATRAMQDEFTGKFVEQQKYFALFLPNIQTRVEQKSFLFLRLIGGYIPVHPKDFCPGR